jgi:predicted DNA-binding protein (UPF0251 family)
MARPFCCRRVAGEPESNYFKPRGVPLLSLDEVVMTVDEFEAIRLADLEGLYQEQAAGRMGISRPTFGRIIESAHRKVADALVGGKALKIEGGEVTMLGQRLFRCNDCQHTWSVPYGTGRPSACPQCKSSNFCRAAEERGQGPGPGRGMRPGGGRRLRARRGARGAGGMRGGQDS